jgi:hypothetical protein
MTRARPSARRRQYSKEIGLIHMRDLPPPDPGFDLERLVELLRRYANRGDLLQDLNRVLARLDGLDVQDAEEEPDEIASDCPPDPHKRLLSERFTQADVEQMLDRYWSGETIQDIAMAFKIGKTSLKGVVPGARRSAR